MPLHTTSLGESGSPVVFCHGLFGQGRNWTQAGKALAAEHRVLLVDMPHHGRSGGGASFDYLDAADRVADLLAQEYGAADPVALVGHSMGGKIAMLLALRHPELVERLCVVDVAPVGYRHSDEFRGYIAGMRSLDLDRMERRAEADEGLSDAVANPTVRSFLLQNLRRDGDRWRWAVDLDVIERDLEVIGGWPVDRVAGASYDGPVLWIAGERSHYVTDDHAEAMEALFPRARRVTVKGAGHWVHSEQPEVFLEVLRRFLR